MTIAQPTPPGGVGPEAGPPVPAPAPAPSSPRPSVEITISPQSVGKLLGLLFLLVLVVVARSALLAIALSIVLVLGLDPPVTALERRGWGRGKAALAAFTALLLAVLVIVVWAAAPVWNEITGFVGDLPGYIDKVQDSAVIKDLDQNAEALEKIKGVAADAAKDIPGAAVNLLGAASGAIGAVFSLVTLAFLTLFGLIAKPMLVRAALELMEPSVASRVDRTLDEVTHTISFALLGNIFISIIAGTVVGMTAWLVDAPSPIVLALIVGLFDLIPQVGSAIAAFIVVLITLVASGVTPALILLAVILLYQQVENYVIQPAVMRQAVELSGFATIAVVMLGSALLGVVGAIVAVPVAASVKIVARELTAGRRERMAALRGGSAGAA
jgi:predicted PurR-regulated permease PerM